MEYSERNVSGFIASNRTELFDNLEHLQWATVIVTVISSAAFVLGTLGNIAVIVLAVSTPVLRTWDNSFHVNLAVVDLLICIIVAPFSMVVGWTPGGYSSFKCAFGRGMTCGPAINVTILAAISALRSYKIQHPTYTVSKGLMKLGIILPWIIGFGVGIIDVVRKKDYPYMAECHSNSNDNTLPSIVPLAIICGIIMFVSYMSAFKTILRQQRAIKPYSTGHIVSTISHPTLDEGDHDVPGTSPARDTTQRRQKRHFVESLSTDYSDVMEVKTGAARHYSKLVQKDSHVIVTSLIVLGVYLFSIMPPILMNRLFAHFRHSVHAYGVSQVCAVLVLVNSFANPLIYTLRTRVMRKRIKVWTTKIRKCFRRSDNEPVDNYI